MSNLTPQPPLLLRGGEVCMIFDSMSISYGTVFETKYLSMISPKFPLSKGEGGRGAAAAAVRLLLLLSFFNISTYSL